jgi:hypothetical protein
MLAAVGQLSMLSSVVSEVTLHRIEHLAGIQSYYMLKLLIASILCCGLGYGY